MARIVEIIADLEGNLDEATESADPKNRNQEKPWRHHLHYPRRVRVRVRAMARGPPRGT